jgi:hypothetical protein
MNKGERDTAALVLGAIGVGALVLRALRTGRGFDAAREDIARVGVAFDQLDTAFQQLARKALSCRAPEQCTCAICAEEQET